MFGVWAGQSQILEMEKEVHHAARAKRKGEKQLKDFRPDVV